MGDRAQGDLRHLGDFTATPRVLAIAAFAIPIGALGACLALALLRLIGLITNLVFYQRLGVALVAPGSGGHSPLLVLLAPVCGGLAIGLIARFGTEKVRGHGIPEAIESILVAGSKVQPRVALLKPIASAIAIGTGGPFGAEGPIIMTGGAFGSIAAQFLHLTADERKTLLVSGAAAGMAATFNAPLASVREYSVDPLEILFVHEVMTSTPPHPAATLPWSIQATPSATSPTRWRPRAGRSWESSIAPTRSGCSAPSRSSGCWRGGCATCGRNTTASACCRRRG